MQSQYLAGAAADDERTKPPSRVRRGGQQRQRRQQVDVPRVGVVLEPERETTPVTAVCGAAASCGQQSGRGVWLLPTARGLCVGCGDSCRPSLSMSGPTYLLRRSVRQPPGGVQSTELSSDS